jgi:hypothetical protein
VGFHIKILGFYRGFILDLSGYSILIFEIWENPGNPGSRTRATCPKDVQWIRLFLSYHIRILNIISGSQICSSFWSFLAHFRTPDKIFLILSYYLFRYYHSRLWLSSQLCFADTPTRLFLSYHIQILEYYVVCGPRGRTRGPQSVIFPWRRSAPPSSGLGQGLLRRPPTIC